MLIEPGRPCFCQDEASKPTYGKLSLSPAELLLLPLQVPSTKFVSIELIFLTIQLTNQQKQWIITMKF